jgi:hypothetical protein
MLAAIFTSVFMSGRPMEFSHNPLTTLLFLCVILALTTGLRKNNNILIAVSGVILSVEVLTRIPNILHLGILLLIIIHALYFKESVRKIIVRIFFFLMGFIISLAVLFGIMHLLGHLPHYLNSWDIVIGMGGNSGETHGIMQLIKVNVLAYYRVFQMAGLHVLIFVAIFFIAKSLCRQWLKNIFYVITSLLLFVFIYVTPVIVNLYALSLIPVVLLLFLKVDKELKVIAWAAVFMMFVLPIGSDEAIYNFGFYSIWLSIAICFGLLYEFFQKDWTFTIRNNNTECKIVAASKELMSIGKTVTISLCFAAVLFLFNKSTYFDPGSRIHKTHPINSSKAKYIYTTKKSATVINDILYALKPYVNEGDYLLAYETVPTIHYLTGTKPYLFNSFPILWDGEAFKRAFDKAKNEIDHFPVVLQVKFETFEGIGNPEEDFISDDNRLVSAFNKPISAFISPGETKTFNDFLRENNYIKVEDTPRFNILIPSE